MTRDVLSSVGLPVLVALLTTLAVEYLAKPRLDARKERITSSRRQVDNVVHGFQLAGMLIGSLLNVPETRDERWRSYVDDRLRRLDESLTTLELDISLLLYSIRREALITCRQNCCVHRLLRGRRVASREST